MNKTNSLEALSLFIDILGSLGWLEALLKVLQTLIEFLPVLEVNSDDLVHSHEFLVDLSLDLSEGAVDTLLQGGLQVVHGLKDVQYFLLTDAQTLVGLSFALDVLCVHGHVQATLMEIRGCLVVV